MKFKIGDIVRTNKKFEKFDTYSRYSKLMGRIIEIKSSFENDEDKSTVYVKPIKIFKIGNNDIHEIENGKWSANAMFFEKVNCFEALMA